MSGTSRILTFSHDGNLVAHCDSIGNVQLWNTARNDLLNSSEDRSYTFLESMKHRIVAKNGRRIASVGDERTIEVWDLSKGMVTRTFEGLSAFDYFPGASFSPNCDLMAVKVASGSIGTFDVSTGTTLCVLGRNLIYIQRIAFSPDGKLAAAAAIDINKPVSKVKFWDMKSGTDKEVGFSGFHSAAAVSPNVDLVALASDDEIGLWDTSRAAIVRTLKGHCSIIGAVVFSPDGKFIASAPGQEIGGSITVWDPATGTTLQSLTGQSERIHSLEFSPDSRTLASASQDKTVMLWDTANGVALRVLLHPHPVTTLVFSPDGMVLASSNSDLPVTFWHVASGTISQILNEPGVVFDFSSNNKLVASTSGDTPSICRRASGANSRILEFHSQIISSAVFSPSGQLVASASENTDIRLWDIATGATIRYFKCRSSHEKIKAMRFSPNGKLLAGGLDFGFFKIWDVEKGVVKHDLSVPSHGTLFNTISFSPDGKFLASGSAGWGIYLWDIETGAVLTKLRYRNGDGYRDAKTHVSLSPDGNFVASCQSNFALRICLMDTNAGTIHQFHDNVSDDPGENILALAVSPDPLSRVVASSSGKF